MADKVRGDATLVRRRGENVTDRDKKEQVKGVASIMKGYAKRLAGEISPRPDLVIEGEKDQTDGLRRIRRSRRPEADGKEG